MTEFNEEDFDPVHEPVPFITTDDLIRVLAPPNSNSPFTRMTGGSPPSKVDTSNGANRVNDNSKSTGTIAYKDKESKTTLTNTAIDITSGAMPTGNVNENAVKMVPQSLPVSNLMNNLRQASSMDVAKTTYDALTGSIAAEKAKLETKALTFAQNKLGIGGLEQQLMASEAADKADVAYYPGIGDSPITQKLRQELNVARGYADVEAKRFLETNVSYKMLGNSEKMAVVELNSQQHKADRLQTQTDAAKIRSDAKTEAIERAEEQASETISAGTLQRMQTLFRSEFNDDTDKPLLKAFRLIQGNKGDKNLMAALQAQGDDLTAMAIKGNGHAKALVISEEATKTGRKPEEINAEIEGAKKLIDSKDFETQWLKLQPNKEGGKAAIGDLQALMLNTDKKQEATDRKVRMVMDIVKARKQINYLGDVSSWNSTDPMMVTAIDASRKTTGNASIENVVTAYLGDTGGQERMARLSAFNRLAADTAAKQSNSLFGGPDFASAKKVLANYSVREGIFSKHLASIWQNVKNTPMSQNLQKVPFAPIKEAGHLLEEGTEAYQYLFGDNKPGIDPATGRPFGE